MLRHLSFHFSQVSSANNIVGMIAGGIGEEVRQVIDVTQPYGITTIATQATSTAFSNTRRFPALLRLAPPNDVTVSLLFLLSSSPTQT